MPGAHRPGGREGEGLPAAGRARRAGGRRGQRRTPQEGQPARAAGWRAGGGSRTSSSPRAWRRPAARASSRASSRPYDATAVRLLKEAGTAHPGQAQPGRVRDGLVQRVERLWPLPQPVGRDAHAGRLLGRLGGGGGGARGVRHAGHGHGRLHPPAGGAHQHRGPQAHLRARVALRRHRLRLARWTQVGPHGAHGGGRGGAAAGAGEA